MEEIKTYQDSKNMNERRPKVSVIMPMYNQEKYIAECLTSVIRQSLKDIEIIVVNVIPCPRLPIGDIDYAPDRRLFWTFSQRRR